MDQDDTGEMKKSKDDMELVSFKLSRDLYKQLKEAAEGQTDEAGGNLSPSQMARRLMLQALKKIGK